MQTLPEIIHVGYSIVIDLYSYITSLSCTIFKKFSFVTFYYLCICSRQGCSWFYPSNPGSAVKILLTFERQSNVLAHLLHGSRNQQNNSRAPPFTCKLNSWPQAKFPSILSKIIIILLKIDGNFACGQEFKLLCQPYM